MRIGVHADPISHKIPGGVGTYTRRLLEELDESKAHNYVAVLTHGSAPVRITGAMMQTRQGMKVVYPGWNYLRRPTLEPDFDVVHATTYVIPAHPRAAVVSTIHDFTVERLPQMVPQPWRALYRRGITRSFREAVICVPTKAVADEVLARGVAAKRVVVTPEAANLGPTSERDDTVFGRLGLEGPYILSVGTLEPRKNHVTLIRAFAAARERLPGYRLVLAGAPGWGADQVATEVARSGPEGIVTAGKVSDAELASLYSRATIFTMASVYEGFGIPVLEAMAFGAPCIASTDPALVEVGGDAAVFLDAHDVEAWSNKLVELAGNAALREELSAAGRLRAADFSWAATAAATNAAYELAVS